MSKTYLVGGAVRDLIMGKEPSDLDYVVVGSSPEEMLEKGFEKVGADFPVFLHPETKDEYALARTERKVGNGYNGFETFFSKDVTIEEDLKRRDTTMNSIAKDIDTGEIIDPYNGVSDIKNKLIRHVSEHFKEDPLRVLRVARFAARFEGFKVAEETMELMKEMYDNGETKHLTKERIWKEFSRAIVVPEGSKFFQVLQNVGLGKDIFPLINGFMNDRNLDFILPRIHVSIMDESLKNADLKERVARWSIPTFSKADMEVVNMWNNLSAPKEVTDHVSNSCSIWNRFISDFSSLKDISKADFKLYEIIKDHDGFRRPERFIEAYSTVKNHLTMLSGNPKCIPEKEVILEWIKIATPTKEDIAKTISNIDKKDIAESINKLKEKKWKSIKNELTSKPRLKMF